MSKTSSSTRLLGVISAGLSASLLLASPGALASSSEITSFNLSNKSLRLNYQALQPAQNRMVDLGVLHHTDNGQLLNIGLHALNELSLGRLAIGARLYGWHTDIRTGGALAIGGTFDATLAHWGNPIGLEVAAYAAPEVTSFNKAKNLLDVDSQLYYQVMPNARAHVGYRLTNVNFVSQDHTLDRGFYVGMALNF